jgi:C4-dicarboxylate-specific signal transduction histidine kinase
MFEPFARISGREPGLQLALALRNVEDAGGSLSCTARNKGGACFCVRLPLYASAL